jgi:hypothetical protein
MTLNSLGFYNKKAFKTFYSLARRKAKAGTLSPLGWAYFDELDAARSAHETERNIRNVYYNEGILGKLAYIASL